MKFGSVILVGVCYVGVESIMEFVLLFISCFDRLGVGVEYVLGYSPSEVGMVTPYDGFVNGMFSGGVVSTGIIPSVFSLVTHWCVCGDQSVCVGNVGVDDVWVVCVVVAGIWSTVSPIIFANFCNASPWRPWNVLFSFLIFWIAQVSVVAIIFVVSIRISVGISQCLG